MSNYVEETIGKYEKYINPAQAKLFRFMGLASIEGHAEGWTITDSEGQEFIDCLGGYGMFALGHRHPKVVEAVEKELHAMPMCGKVLFNRPMADLAEALAEITPGELQYSFFVNSGTESVEGCLKVARLATKRKKFVAAKNAFHGKTFGSLTATGRDMYREPFKPLLDGFTHVEYGDAAAVDAAVDEDTAAVILEPVQGEGGIIVPPAGYLREVKEICEKKGALLIADEVQTGIGRTGSLFAYQQYGVQPDIVSMAKGLGGGVPIGGVMAAEKCADVLGAGTHGTTFGGNPLCCAAANTVLSIVNTPDFLQEVQEKGEYLKNKILSFGSDKVKTVRGMGLMLGIVVDKDERADLVAKLMDKGILVLTAGTEAIRLLPPLVISYEEMDEALAVMKEVF